MNLGQQKQRNFQEKVKNPHKRQNPGHKHGVLVSRLPLDFQLPINPDNIVFLPQIRGTNGGICFIFVQSKLDLEDVKVYLKSFKNIKLTEFYTSNKNEQKDIFKSFGEMEDLFKNTISSKLFKIYKKKFPQNAFPDKILSELEEISNEVKQLCEKLLIQYADEVILTFNRFMNQETINEDLKIEEFSYQMLLGISCFCMRKLKPENLCKKRYFFNDFRMIKLLKNFEILARDKKVYIIDVLFQIIFLKKPFENPESVMKSIFKSKVIDEQIILKLEMKDLASKIVKILKLIGLKYFQNVKKDLYTQRVAKFIKSVNVTKIPGSLLGLTLMNSSVLINDTCLINHRRLSKVERFIACDAFIILTCIHEFGHFIQRSEFQKKIEWFEYETPTDYILNYSGSRCPCLDPTRSSECLIPPELISPPNIKSESPVSKVFSSPESRNSSNQLKSPESLFKNLESPKRLSSPLKSPRSPKREIIENQSQKSSNSSPLKNLDSPASRNLENNALRDSKCSTIRESDISSSPASKSLKSKKAKSASPVNVSSQQPSSPPEGGSMLIEAIFGYEINLLNYYDSIFIANIENWKLSESEFRMKFLEEANKANPIEYKKYFPVRCSQNQAIFPIFLGACGTA